MLLCRAWSVAVLVSAAACGPAELPVAPLPEAVPFAPSLRPIEADVGAPPCIALSPTDVDFGAIRVTCGPATRHVALFNVCDTAVRVDGVRVQPSSATSAFGVDSVPPGTWLEPHTGTLLSVTYAPLVPGPDAAAVIVTAQQHFWVSSLRGTAEPKGQRTDTFRQAAERSVLYLSAPPEPDTLAVTFDGVTVPLGQSTWRYDAAVNGVVFQPGALPTTETTIRIGYDVACAL